MLLKTCSSSLAGQQALGQQALGHEVSVMQHLPSTASQKCKVVGGSNLSPAWTPIFCRAELQPHSGVVLFSFCSL